MDERDALLCQTSAALRCERPSGEREKRERKRDGVGRRKRERKRVPSSKRDDIQRCTIWNLYTASTKLVSKLCDCTDPMMGKSTCVYEHYFRKLRALTKNEVFCERVNHRQARRRYVEMYAGFLSYLFIASRTLCQVDVDPDLRNVCPAMRLMDNNKM